MAERLAERLKRVRRESGTVGAMVRMTSNLVAQAGRAVANGADRVTLRTPMRWLTQPTISALLESNARFADRHSGETCIILGTGPSLKSVDISQFAHVPLFTVNQGFLFCEARGIRPDYAVVVDEMYFTPNFVPFMRDLLSFCAARDTLLFANVSGHAAMTTLEAAKSVDLAWLHPIMRSRLWETHGRPVPIELTAAQPGYESVIHAAIVVALYMGFSRIVLIGCDMDYHVRPHEVYRHAYDDSPYIADNRPVAELFEEGQVDLMARALCEYRAFAALGRLAHGRGQEIINASAGGYLDVYPRVPLDKAIGIAGGEEQDRSAAV
ncbi:MAG: 6-hydroxymethylpterin diphosphokinase MptE-like protein [Pseudomonadota bacterium]